MFQHSISSTLTHCFVFGQVGLAWEHKELLFTDISDVVNTDDCWIQGRPAWGSFIKMEAARTILFNTTDFFNTESKGFPRNQVEKTHEEANKIKFTDKYKDHIAPLQQEHNENLGFCLQYAYAYNIITPELIECFPRDFPFAPT